MDFLVKHYEKLILGGSLICLIVCILLASNGVKSNKEEARAKEKEAEKSVKSLSNVLADIDETKFNGAEALKNPYRLVAVENVNQKKGGLMDPKRYVICKNYECGYFISFNADRCPFCNTLQEPIGKEPTPEDDTDSDGMPDMYEQQYRDSLDYLDPDDAKFDADEDGFLNIEEYKENTDPENPDSHPALAKLLRLLNTQKAPLPIVFERLRTADSTNRDDWRLVFKVKGIDKSIKLDEKIENFTVTSVDPEGASVTVEDAKGEAFVLPKHKVVTEKINTVFFVYLNYRERANFQACRRYRVHEGERFELVEPNGGNIPKRETYIVRPVGDDGEVKIVRWNEQEEKEDAEFVIGKIDKDNDFYFEEPMTRNGMNGMPNGMNGGRMPVQPMPGRARMGR